LGSRGGWEDEELGRGRVEEDAFRGVEVDRRRRLERKERRERGERSPTILPASGLFMCKYTCPYLSQNSTARSLPVARVVLTTLYCAPDPVRRIWLGLARVGRSTAIARVQCAPDLRGIEDLGDVKGR
jgi:hypothetical protein